MDLESLVLFDDNLPDYALDNMWFVEIKDQDDNKIKFNDVKGKFDSYVSEINIPQESLKFEKTSFGLPMFQDQDEYEGINLTFFDDTKCTMSKFFQDWLDSIYDRYKRQLKKDWRRQSKSITAYLVKLHNKRTGYNFLQALGSNIASQASALINKKYLGMTEYSIFATYELENCYPVALEALNLGSDSGERLAFTLKLECERMNPKYGDDMTITKG